MKKVISILMTLALVIGLVPSLPVHATEGEAVTHTVTFDLNCEDETATLTGDNVVETDGVYTIEVADGESLGDLPIATREKYIFQDWWTTSNVYDENGYCFTEEDEVTEDITVYAQWTACITSLEFSTIGYDDGWTDTEGIYKNMEVFLKETEESEGEEVESDSYTSLINIGESVELPTLLKTNGLFEYGDYIVFKNGEPTVLPTTWNDTDLKSYTTQAGENYYNLPSGEISNDYGIENVDIIYCYLQIIPKTASITFDVGAGATIDSDSTVSIKLNETVPELPSATKEGYGFKGWKITDENGNEYELVEGEVFNPLPITDIDLTATAIWSEGEFSVTFDANGGSTDEESRTKKASETVGTLPSATKEGYKFKGWFTSVTGGEQITKNTVVTKDLSLYAQYEAKKVLYVFDANGGSVEKSYSSVPFGDVIGTLPNASRENYEFAGWFTTKTGGTKVTSYYKVEEYAGVVELYAQWTKKSCTVTMNGNGAENQTTTVESGEEIGTLPSPSRKGYTFVGWFTSATSGRMVYEDNVIKSDTTIYAQWEKITLAKPTIKSVKNVKSKKMTVALKKKIENADGYEISYSTSKKFKKVTKITRTGIKNTVKKLQKGKKYYVRVRAYKIDSAGSKVYSNYSKVKSVKIKR